MAIRVACRATTLAALAHCPRPLFTPRHASLCTYLTQHFCSAQRTLGAPRIVVCSSQPKIEAHKCLLKMLISYVYNMSMLFALQLIADGAWSHFWFLRVATRGALLIWHLRRVRDDSLTSWYRRLLSLFSLSALSSAPDRVPGATSPITWQPLDWAKVCCAPMAQPMLRIRPAHPP